MDLFQACPDKMNPPAASRFGREAYIRQLRAFGPVSGRQEKKSRVVGTHFTAASATLWKLFFY